MLTTDRRGFLAMLGLGALATQVRPEAPKRPVITARVRGRDWNDPRNPEFDFAEERLALAVHGEVVAHIPAAAGGFLLTPHGAPPGHYGTTMLGVAYAGPGPVIRSGEVLTLNGYDYRVTFG